MIFAFVAPGNGRNGSAKYGNSETRPGSVRQLSDQNNEKNVWTLVENHARRIRCSQSTPPRPGNATHPPTDRKPRFEQGLLVHGHFELVAALIERKLRLAMKQKTIDSLPICPEKRPCKAPAIFDIVRLFRNVERYEVETNGETIIFPAQLTREQKQELIRIAIARRRLHR